MKETIERSKVTSAEEFETVEFHELDGISTFRALGKDVRYLVYGTCALLGWGEGLATPIAHHILFRADGDLTIFLMPEELARFGEWTASTEPPKPHDEVDLSFRRSESEVETLFNNLVNFRPELATSLEQEGRLVTWMAATFKRIEERARQFEEAPYGGEGQGWSEAMMEYLSNGPQKEKYRALSQKRKGAMWSVIMGLK
jgi:hypothetical protein